MIHTALIAVFDTAAMNINKNGEVIKFVRYDELDKYKEVLDKIKEIVNEIL